MPCTLLIPNLIPRVTNDNQDNKDNAAVLMAWKALHAPQLKRLLDHARMTRDKGKTALDWNCAAFHLARRDDSTDWPLAPLLARVDGVDSTSGYWFTAAPIHLAAGRTGLTVMDPSTLGLEVAEAASLADTLGQHLAGEHITLHTPDSGRWYIACDTIQAVTTHPIESALGRDARGYLPQGKDRLKWHRILTEIEMLLHAHPVNERRAAKGLPPVNSVWLSYGGLLPARDNADAARPSAIRAVLGNAAITQALASHAGITHAPLPEHFSGAVDGTLVVFEPLPRQDAQAWTDAVMALESRWFAPAAKALRYGELDEVRIVCARENGSSSETLCFVARKWQSLKIFFKNKYLQ